MHHSHWYLGPCQSWAFCNAWFPRCPTKWLPFNEILWQAITFFMLNEFHSNFTYASVSCISQTRLKFAFLWIIVTKITALQWNSLTRNNSLLSEWILFRLHACNDISDKLEVGLSPTHVFQDGWPNGSHLMDFFSQSPWVCQCLTVLVSKKFSKS